MPIVPDEVIEPDDPRRGWHAEAARPARPPGSAGTIGEPEAPEPIPARAVLSDPFLGLLFDRLVAVQASSPEEALRLAEQQIGHPLPEGAVAIRAFLRPGEPGGEEVP